MRPSTPSFPMLPTSNQTNPGSRTYTQNEYVFEEPDRLDSIADWQLEGDDAGAFDLSGGFEPRYIQFKEAPDFENPTDANSDNVYEVTLVATDTGPDGGRPRHRQGKRVADRHRMSRKRGRWRLRKGRRLTSTRCWLRRCRTPTTRAATWVSPIRAYTSSPGSGPAPKLVRRIHLKT